MDPFRPSSHSPFQSRRSHPSLNHISLAPLTPRFPIDDLPEQDDYFQNINHGHSTSYLSSSSVPTTPPIISHSRASSRSRHHRRSKSSNHALSDTDLRSLGARRSAPYQQSTQHIGGSRSNSKGGSQTPGISPSREKRRPQDSEWLLRAGLALTSSTREEKGQSWLVKRESSTSLVAEAEPEVIRMARPHRRGRSTPFRSARSSAISTPAALSRRPSRSREHSRRASRADFSMTAMGIETGGASRNSRKSSMGSYHATLPDFVDEQIRAEIASINNGRDLYDALDDEDDELSGSSSYGSDSETDGEMDEREFQRLTRERGFGLGTWVDQFVSWTLFGVEEDVSTSEPVDIERSSRHAIVAFEPAGSTTSQDDPVDELDDDQDESTDSVEKAGEKGGWADATWFLRLARKAII